MIDVNQAYHLSAESQNNYYYEIVKNNSKLIDLVNSLIIKACKQGYFGTEIELSEAQGQPKDVAIILQMHGFNNYSYNDEGHGNYKFIIKWMDMQCSK